ncbi:transcriptional regulator, LysR family [Jannaschia faecimaris]|uniref:Transcriptional regulator, LysR family n=1 Tax=Jannaschia faecimaris TaxID=1244108 RepID=A0A1H3UFP5_9RHOB|nr:LysR family transcriptional regulator [Jannaschia faecimaris]SDZ61244.1 transcriptional regulator, LysR family [Jannaschia faecimaris]
MQLDWNEIRYFLELVRAGSIKSAADVLDVNQTTVSRRISALEANLSTRLINRSGKQWNLTAAGERLVPQAELMSDHVNTIQREILAEADELRGLVRVTTGELAFRIWLLPILKQFMKDHPKIELQLLAGSQVLNLDSREADIAVRFSKSPPEDTIAKRVSGIAYHTYGSPQLQKQFLANAEDSELPILAFANERKAIPDWAKHHLPNAKQIVLLDDLSVMLEAAKLGMGVAQLPCMIADHDPDLVRIFPANSSTDWGVWVLSHVDLRTTARVRALRNAIVSGLMRHKNLFEGHLPLP